MQKHSVISVEQSIREDLAFVDGQFRILAVAARPDSDLVNLRVGTLYGEHRAVADVPPLSAIIFKLARWFAAQAGPKCSTSTKRCTWKSLICSRRSNAPCTTAQWPDCRLSVLRR